MNILKKQSVAWIITIVMVLAAVGIGRAKNSGQGGPQPGGGPPAGGTSYVWDDAGVLSSRTRQTLDDRNSRLLKDCDAIIGVATCRYDGDDLGGYAIKLADEMGLGGYDMIVVLDVKGDDYWLVQGADLVRYFTDQDCSDYAWSYMEDSFAKGDYDSAVLSLTQALEDWYRQADY